MKALARLTSLATLSVALSTVTFAASKNQGNFTLPDTVRIGSTELRAGEYKAEWQEEAGGGVKVEILQNGKTVATAEGKLKDLPSPAPYSAVVTKSLSDNAKEIDEIDFNKRSQALVFGE
jgi:hypothetical protein